MAYGNSTIYQRTLHFAALLTLDWLCDCFEATPHWSDCDRDQSISARFAEEEGFATFKGRLAIYGLDSRCSTTLWAHVYYTIYLY
jgi:hypothetical protein